MVNVTPQILNINLLVLLLNNISAIILNSIDR